MIVAAIQRSVSTMPKSSRIALNILIPQRQITTTTTRCQTKVNSLIHTLGQENKNEKSNTSWLERQKRLEQLNKPTPKRSPKSPKTSKTPKSDTGFTKVGKDRKVQTRSAATTMMEKDKKSEYRTRKELERLQAKLHESELEGWRRRKIELKLKLGDQSWNPTKKLAVSSMEKVRMLNEEFPEVWTITKLSDQFKVSREAIRRILKSKFRPSEERVEKRECVRKEQHKEFARSMKNLE